MAAISCASIRLISAIPRENYPRDEAAVLLWSFWNWSHVGPGALGAQDHHPDAVLEAAADPIEWRAGWLGASWCRDPHEQLALWRRLEECTELRFLRTSILRMPYDWQIYMPVAPLRYRKLMAVVKFVEARMPLAFPATFTLGLEDQGEWSPVAMLFGAVEDFAKRSEGQWLKVAGGEKGECLERLLCNVPLGMHHAILEFGCFVGFTSVRLAQRSLWHLRRSSLHEGQRVTSIEGDPIHTAVARHFINLIESSTEVEVIPGQVRDTQPLVQESAGWNACSFTFMDQKGTTFHADLCLLERLNFFSPLSACIADNVLRPGAPVFMWNMTRTPPYESSNWSLPEFLEEKVGVEDWEAVGKAQGWRIPCARSPPASA